MSTNTQATSIRQAMLSTAEFSYLLNLVSAKVVIGVDNDHLFPKNEADQKTMWAAGFQKLIENGWLIKEGNKHNISNQLVLMVATVANPELTMMLTRYTARGEQVITYYCANDHIVEQIRTADDQYRLVPFSGFAAMSERIRTTLGAAADDENRDTHTVTLPIASFGEKLKLAQSGEVRPLQEAIAQQGLSVEQSKRWTEMLMNAKPAIFVEWGLFIQNGVLGKRDSFIVEGSDPRLLIINDPTQDNITIMPCSNAQLSHHIQTVWQACVAYRRNILSKMREAI